MSDHGEHPTDFMSQVARELRPKPTFFTALDLFAGCGGLALGFEAAGINTIGYELNLDCCNTYNRNLNGTCSVANLSQDTVFPHADIVIGGPPCQPFSVGGKQAGLKDSRDGFPAFISAIRQVQPKLWLFENVRGMLYKNNWYLEEIIADLEKLGYVVDLKLLNVSDYGVPQNRERLVVVGHHGNFKFPTNHNRRFSAGEALGTLAEAVPPGSKFLTASQDAYVAKYERASKCRNPRDLNLSKPARTLTCRNLAGATGDMQRVKLPDGRRRRLLVREAARLQTFPDWFEFSGGETSQFNQIGNAVPPIFAKALADACISYFNGLREASERSTTLRPRQGVLSF